MYCTQRTFQILALHRSSHSQSNFQAFSLKRSGSGLTSPQKQAHKIATMNMKRESMNLKSAVISRTSAAHLSSFLSLTSPLKEIFSPCLHINYTHIMHIIMCINYNDFNCSIFFRKTDALCMLSLHVSKVFLCCGISYKQHEVVLSSGRT